MDELPDVSYRKKRKRTNNAKSHLPKPNLNERELQKDKEHKEIKVQKTRNQGVHTSQERSVSSRRDQSTNKKRKRARELPTSGEEEKYEGTVGGEISEAFQIEEEDLLQHNATKTNNSKSQTLIEPTVLPSQPMDFMFIEKKDGQGFIKEHKSRVLRNQNDRGLTSNYQLNLMQDASDDTALDFMLGFHRVFRSVALIAHGLLAGMAISQCIFIYVLDSTNVNLLTNYYKLAAPFHSVYYMLLAFCTVSVFDRYLNVGSSWTQLVYRLLSKPSRVVASSAYLLAFIFSVSIALLDDRISLFNDLPDLWKSTEKIKAWKILNLVRVIGAVLGWILVAIAPNDDVTEKNILEAIENEQTTEYELTSPRNGNWRINNES